MPVTPNAPTPHPFFSLPPLVTFKDFVDFCKAYGLRVYTRSHVTKMMNVGKFPAPLYLHEHPMHWKREDVLAWFRSRGIDTPFAMDRGV